MRSLRLGCVLVVLLCARSVQAFDPMNAGLGVQAGSGAPPPISLSRVFTGPIPTDGAVLLIDESADPVVMRVTDANGAEVAGTYQQIHWVFWAWKANAPMLPGEYTIEAVHADLAPSSFYGLLEVVETDMVTPPTLVPSPALTVVTDLRDPLCCTWWTSTNTEEGRCQATRQFAFARLEAGLTSPDPLMSNAQFLYRVWAPSQESDPPQAPSYMPWGTLFAVTFEEGADEYCYEIEALSINDLSVHRYDELAGRCAPHGSLPTLGTTPVELPAELFERSQCTVPPEGTEAAWCEANADCADHPDEYACSQFDHLCRGGADKPWTPPVGGSGGSQASGGSGGFKSGGAGGSQASGGSGEAKSGGAGGASGAAGMMNEAPTGSRARSSSGCSVAGAGHERSAGGFLALTLGIACALVVRRKRARSLLGLLLSAGLCGLSFAEASAQDVQALRAPPAVNVVSRGPIPGNGALLILDSGVMPTSVEVTGPNGDPIVGSYVHVAFRYSAWRPSAPIAPGTYAIRSTEGPPLSATFEVGEEADLSAPELMSAPSASAAMFPGGGGCCDVWTDNGVDVGGCSWTSFRHLMVLPNLTSSESPAVLDQFLLSVVPAGEEHSYYARWGDPLEANFDTQADEYCYALEVISIVDSSVHRYEELAHCAPHGAIGELGNSATTPESLDRASCTSPPTGLEDIWCDLNADCADSPSDETCVLFDHLCNGGPAVAPPQGPTEALPDAGRLVEDEEGTMHDDTETTPEAAAGGGDCSCRMAHARGGSGSPVGALLLLAAGAALGARRRRDGQRAAVLGVARVALGASLAVLALASHAYANTGGSPAFGGVGGGFAAGAGGVGGFGGGPFEPSPGPFLVSTQPIPGNGALLLTDYGGNAFSLIVTSPEGEPVEGTYVQVRDAYWAWRPSVVLAPGEYLIESTGGPPLHQRNGLLSTTFTVVAVADLSFPVLNSEPSVSLVSLSSDSFCCELWTDFGIESGSCSPTRQETYAALQPGLSSSSGAIALSQFLFMISPKESAGAGYAPWSASQELPFTVEAEEYCYEVSAISIVDSTEQSYTDLTPRCVPHGELGALGSTPIEPPASFYDRARCTEPPDGFDAAWCELNADCEDSTEPDCVLFEYLCNDGVRPMWMPPIGGFGGFGGFGGGGFGGFGGLIVTGGTGGHIGGEGGAAGMQGGKGGSASKGGEDPPKRSSKGCSIALDGTRSQTSAAWLLLGLAFALLGLRKR
jgi:hypothetical protein